MTKGTLIKKISLILVMLISFSNTSDFKVQTEDLIVEEKKDKVLIKESKIALIKDEDLEKNDPLLETIEIIEKKEPSLLEKLLLLMSQKEKEKEKEKNEDESKEKINKKTTFQDNDILTPDPLLNEI